MNTISNIQKFLQFIDIKERFKNGIYSIVESYSIQGNIFAMDNFGNAVELDSGYFVEDKEYDNLNDCIKEMNIRQAIRIVEDKFILGTVEYQLSNCKENKKVIDIKYLKYIRE